jgi:hypothetical protein
MLGGLEMPIISVPSVEETPSIIAAFCRQLASQDASIRDRKTTQELIAHCTGTSQPLSEHTTNILSDITSSLQDLVGKVSSAEGQRMLIEYLGHDAESVIRFWQEERRVD